MVKSGDTTAAEERSRWLAELAEAIGQAQRLVRTLSASQTSLGKRAEAKDLFGHLEAIRIEVDALRRGGWVPRQTEIDPSWINLIPWNRRSAG